MDDSNNFAYHDSSCEPRDGADAAISDPNRSEGILAGMKKQSSSTPSGSSISNTQQDLTTIASEKLNLNGMKELIFDDVVPVAGGALQSAQECIYTLAGKAAGVGERQARQGLQSPDPDHELIDQMDDERICDFLREKHSSTVQPPSTK
ncbi:uncharacterized protein N7482_001135 [Penicillium canariense]|uniref:Uncharacterized protein n=1 Tax=Penicillium canariense TaxID=189055 RepID=A0A9W9IEJ7_9EURO|nr:uncharacterized protein N7482_001135 [Penicillium canariense]KAJ5175258.1 hypothetical protein N7482_001135 [Penicillium canariense]